MKTTRDAAADRGMRGRLIVSMLGGLFFVYVGSIGPAFAYLYEHQKFSDRGKRGTVEWFYSPVTALAAACPPIDQGLEWFFSWCSRVMYPNGLWQRRF